jgi:tRNA(Ile)-lysidine synthase
VHDHLASFKDTIALTGSKEDLGRKARRLFFKKVMQEYHAQAIALAHHRDDQIETFFIRLIRGTTLSGLCGMRPKSGPYIRPLLATSKQAIIDYLTHHNITYLTDPSNASAEFLRNRIRMQVLPALHACDPRFESNTIKTMHHLQLAEDYLSEHTKTLFNQMRIPTNGSIAIAYDQLLAQPFFMQYRILMHWLIEIKVPFNVAASFLQEIIRFLHATKSTTHYMHHQWYLQKENNILKLMKGSLHEY